MNNYQQRQLSTFFSKLIGIIFIMAALLLLLPQEPQVKTYKLTDEQIKQIAYQLKLNGYKELIKNGCSKYIAENLQTGHWSDYYCAEKYYQLEIK